MVSPDIPTALLVNAKSRRGRQFFAEYEARCQQSLRLVRSQLTESRDAMERELEWARHRGIRRIIVGGGDGTLSFAANSLVNTDAVMGVLPLGTGNTFAHGLGLPGSPSELVRLLAQGPVAAYDVGLASNGSKQTVILNSLTLGFSERLVELLSQDRKSRWGYLAWTMEVRRALKNTPVLHVHLSWPTGQESYTTRQLVVVNGRTVAAGISATPLSSAQDGLLEVFRLGGPSVTSMAWLSLKLLIGTLLTDRQAHYHAVPEVTIHTHPAVTASIDGDIWLTPPIHCRVLPQALWVISPHKAGPSTPKRWPLATRTVGAPGRILPLPSSYAPPEIRDQPPT
ncbi:MAG: diacylglycerol kinase [Sulfobacillus acidophilus]|uniref:Diacylglycerol kinase n=1 Tax=Sulfobacillus acidophilus TaxID=53633 RepID=A0A2T2WKR6_9FIRM|nr:MAG: diacylglycerol kinase [Sulfobacillus acidophilus]